MSQLTRTIEAVKPADACPSCGERSLDLLTWVDDRWCRCGSCGRTYRPGPDDPADGFDLLAYVRAQAGYYRMQGGPAVLCAEALDLLAAGVRACSTPGEPLTVDDYRDRIAILDEMAAEQAEADRVTREVRGYPRAERRAAPTPGRNVAPVDPEQIVEF